MMIARCPVSLRLSIAGLAAMQIAKPLTVGCGATSGRAGLIVTATATKEKGEIMLYVIDYGFGVARLYTPNTDWEGRFYCLASECFGIRKSIMYAKLLSATHITPAVKMDGEYERLEHNGDVIVWNQAGEKIKSEWDDFPAKTAPVAEEQRGWIATNDPVPYVCPVCGERSGYKPNFCPECGERLVW